MYFKKKKTESQTGALRCTIAQKQKRLCFHDQLLLQVMLYATSPGLYYCHNTVSLNGRFNQSAGGENCCMVTVVETVLITL